MRAGVLVAVGLWGCGTGVMTAAGGGAASATLEAPSALEVRPLSGGVHVTWRDNSAAEDDFQLQRRVGGGDFQVLATLTFDSTQFHDQGVQPGVEYAYRVRAESLEQGNSAYSNTASLTLAGAAGGGGGGGGGAATGGGAGTGGGAASGGGSASGGGAAQVSLRNDVVPVFKNSCGSGNTSCHAAVAYAATSNMECRGWLSLVDEPEGATYNGAPTGCANRTLHQRLTALKAWLCSPQKAYVVPGDPGSSHLFQMVAGDPTGGGTCWKVAPGNGQTPVATTRMPPSPAVMPPAELETLRQWILQGAKDN